MSLRRRRTGQELAKGVARPPVTTVKQETQPRTESAEPRSLEHAFRSRLSMKDQIITHLGETIADLQESVHIRDQRILALQAEVDQRRETNRNLALAAEEVDKRHRAELAAATAGLAGMLRESAAPAGVDPQPTEPLPPTPTPSEWAREQDRRVMERLYGAAFDRGLGVRAIRDEQSLARNAEAMSDEAALSDPWPGDEADDGPWAPMPPVDMVLPWPGQAWQPRSSAGQSAPLVGE